jgi:hypothetical protein
VRGVAGLQLGCCPGLAQKAALLFFFVLLHFSIFVLVYLIFEVQKYLKTKLLNW